MVKKIVLAGLWVTVAIQVLSLFSWPDNGTDWPVSLGWGSLLAPMLAITFCQWWKHKDYRPFLAILFFSAVWGMGFISRFDAETNAKMYTLLTLLLVVFTEQWKMVKISAVMAALGVVMFALDAAHIGWYVCLNVLFGLALVSSSVERKQQDAPKTRAVSHQEQSKAA